MRAGVGMTAFGPRTSHYSIPKLMAPHLSIPQDLCPTAVTHKNHSTLAGAKVVFSYMAPFLSADLADGFCCSSTKGFYYTSVQAGPSSKYPGQHDYICSEWAAKDPNVPITFVPGNTSTSAGLSTIPPPPDPQCHQKQTVADCLKGVPTFASCAWLGDRCDYKPPIECGGFNPTLPKMGPFCIGIHVAPQAFPSGPSGRQLRAFNWTQVGSALKS